MTSSSDSDSDVWRQLIGMTVRLDRWEVVSPDPKKPIVLFHFEVQLTTGSAWTVSQRYSGLRDFHRALSAKLPGVKLPAFPSKQVFAEAAQQSGMARVRLGSLKLASGKDADFTERRAAALAKYLAELAQIAQVRECPDFQSFMLIPKTVTASMRRVSTAPAAWSGKSVNLVFGVPVAELVAHPCNEGDTVPLLLRVAVDYLLASDGLREEGLFRVPAMASELERLKTVVNQGQQRIDFATVKDRVNVAGGLLKQYVRELPEPLLGPCADQLLQLVDAHRAAAAAADDDNNNNDELLDSLDGRPAVAERARRTAAVLARLPDANRHTLDFLLRFLRQVAALAAVNKMTPPNLAIVFGPPLLFGGQRQLTFSPAAMDTARATTLVIFLIRIPTHYFFPCPSAVSPSPLPVRPASPAAMSIVAKAAPARPLQGPPVPRPSASPGPDSSPRSRSSSSPVRPAAPPVIAAAMPPPRPLRAQSHSRDLAEPPRSAPSARPPSTRPPSRAPPSRPLPQPPPST